MTPCRKGNVLTAFYAAAALTLAAGTAGCSSVKNDAAYEDAQKQVELARADPEVRRHASGPLQDAEETLARAAEAENQAELHHLTYLTQKKVEIARSVAAAMTAEQRLKSLSERQKQRQSREVDKAPLPPPVTEDTRTEEENELARKLAREREEQAIAAARDAQKRVEELEKAVAEFKAHQESRGVVLTLPDVSFAAGEARVNPAVERRLSPLARYLGENPDRKVIIEGYTDTSGDHEANLMLSHSRAEAVKNLLVEKGVAEERILTVGRGENDPVADNGTDWGRRQNRRVEIVLVGTQAPDQVGTGPENR